MVTNAVAGVAAGRSLSYKAGAPAGVIRPRQAANIGRTVPMTLDSRNIPVDELRQLLVYEPDTGHLIWKVRPREFFTSDRICNSWNGAYAGRIAGCIDGKGYMKVAIFNKGYRSHRVAWALYYGEWPADDLEIDHIDTDATNNRIANLRLVTRGQNECNKPKRKNTKSPLKGVSWNSQKRKWMATLAVNGKVKPIGFFDSDVDAHECYKKAAAETYGEYARFK